MADIELTGGIRVHAPPSTLASNVAGEESGMERSGLVESGKSSLQLDDRASILSSEPDLSPYGQVQTQKSFAVTRPWLNISRGVKLYVSGMFCGSAMMALAKLAAQDASFYVVSFMRMLFTFVVAMICLVVKGEGDSLFGPPGLRMAVAARGSLGTLVLIPCYFAVQYIPLPDFSLMNFLIPLVTAASACLVLGESYHWTQAASSIISLLGVIVITRPSFLFGNGRVLPPGVQEWQYDAAIAAMIVQICATAAVFIVLRKIGGRVDPLVIMANYALQTVFVSLAGIVGSAALDPANLVLPTKLTTWLSLMGCSISGFAYQYLFTLAVAEEKATVLTQLDYIDLLFFMGWEYFLWNTLPDIFSILGGGLILAGVFGATHYSSQRKTSRTASTDST